MSPLPLQSLSKEIVAKVDFIVDIKKEHIAVAEAKKLNIPTIAMVDTNSDPNLVDFPIPANDDAAKSIQIILKALSDAVIEGNEERKKKKEDDREKETAHSEETAASKEVAG